jgi:spore germination protein YaaH
MGNKFVMCTIEARTPLDSRYDGVPPKDAGLYVNDYKEINRYCDRVRIMAYDQGSIDVKLNRARAAPYVPVSDPAWAEKVLKEALKAISKKKLVLGIATYGYEYEVKPLTEYGYRYSRLWALNPKYAIDLAAKANATPVRNAAGEMSFIYKSAGETPTGDTIPITMSNDPTVEQNLYSQVAIASSIQPPFNIVWWSDAQAVKQKIELAEKLGIRGVAFFKWDGGQDPAIWPMLPVRR